MKDFDFKRMTLSERQARIKNIIKEKTKGKISDLDVRQIVDNININLQYKIKVVRNPEIMKRELTLANQWWQRNEWRYIDSEGIKETAEIMLGTCEFGSNHLFEKSENGNVVDEGKSYKEPIFFFHQILVITKNIHEWQKVEGDERNYGRKKNVLVIYIPKKN